MALRSPEVKLTGTRHNLTDSYRVRVQPGLVASGIMKHVVPIADAVPAGKKGTRLVVIWPRDLPGLVGITFTEASARLQYKHEEKRYRSLGKEEIDQDEELVRIDLAREPGDPGPVRHRPHAEPLFRKNPYATRFEGVVFDLEVLIFETTDTSREPAQRLWVEGLPIVEAAPLGQDDALDQKEGWSREVLAMLRFNPYTVKGVPLLERQVEWDYLVDSWSFTPLPHAVSVEFKVKNGKDAKPVDLADRYVLGLHIVQSIQGDVRGTPPPKADVYLDSVGVAPRLVPSLVRVSYTPDKAEALPALADVPLPTTGQKTVWVKEVAVDIDPDKVLPKEAGSGLNVVHRHVHKVSQYWLLPTDMHARKQSLLLSKVPDLATARPPERVPPNGAYSQEVTFELESEWDRYADQLARIERHLALMRAWQELYAAHYAKHRDELEAFTRIVEPICGDQALGLAEFPTKVSTPGGMKSKPLRWLRHEGYTASTQGKLRTLRRITERAAYHAKVAIDAYESDEVWRTFFPVGRKDPFLGQRRGFRRLRYTDSFAGYRTTIGERDYVYDDDWKLHVAGEIAGTHSLLQQEVEGAQAQAERRQRAARFQRHVQPVLVELLRSEQEGRPATFLAEKVTAVQAWATLAGGGYALFYYGDDLGRNILARRIIGPSTDRYTWLGFFGKDDEFEQLAEQVAQREGLPKASWEHVRYALGMIKVGTQILNLIAGGNPDRLRLGLDWTEALLAGTETLLRTVKLVKPTWFEGGAVGARALTVVGKVAAALALVIELYTIVKVFWDLERGRLVKPGDFYFALANIAVMAIALYVPVVGAIIAAVVLFIRNVYDYYNVTGPESIPAWYCRTPWGENIYHPYAKYNGGELPWTDRRRMFIEGCNALNRLLHELYSKMKEVDRERFRAFYQQWAESNAAVVRLRVSPYRSGDDYFLIKLYDGAKEVTSQSAEG